MTYVCGSEDESDALVAVTLGGEGIDIEVVSRNKKLFGRHIENALKSVCESMHVDNVTIAVKDFGALDFVIKARMRTALSDALCAASSEPRRMVRI
jgi:citrate lyase subunit gamma (acyl carrier protein)